MLLHEFCNNVKTPVLDCLIHVVDIRFAFGIGHVIRLRMLERGADEQGPVPEYDRRAESAAGYIGAGHLSELRPLVVAQMEQIS